MINLSIRKRDFEIFHLPRICAAPGSLVEAFAQCWAVLAMDFVQCHLFAQCPNRINLQTGFDDLPKFGFAPVRAHWKLV